jgi:branched-chain amino acid transport system permease protein
MSFLVTQAILAGIVNGCIYALTGMGLAAIFKGTRVINAMQGEFSIIAAIVAVLLMREQGYPYWVAVLAGLASGAVIGAAVEVFLVRPMNRRNASEDSYLLLTIGLAMTMSACVLFFVGRDSYGLAPIGGDGVIFILDAILQEHAAWLIVIALLISFGIRQFYHKTILGLSMMAASIDPDGAATSGIDVRLMRTYTFVLGGLLGAIAGILVAPIVPVNYHLGLALTLKGFAAAILGGLTNPLGAVVGGLTLGLVESLAIIGVSSGYKDVVAFSALIAIMILMPQGLLGRAGRKGG